MKILIGFNSGQRFAMNVRFCMLHVLLFGYGAIYQQKNYNSLSLRWNVLFGLIGSIKILA